MLVCSEIKFNQLIINSNNQVSIVTRHTKDDIFVHTIVTMKSQQKCPARTSQ